MRHFTAVDSTNREATRWAEQGAPEGAMVLADHQWAGRGRLGRSWVDVPGESLLLSIVLRPPLTPSQAAPATFVAAVALADALTRWVPREAIEIKWPNDVLLGGRKTAGILLEARGEDRRLDHLILGVGINVGGTPERIPPDLRDRCTSVAAWAGTAAVDRLELLGAFLGELEGRYEGFLAGGLEVLASRWNQWFRMRGCRIRVQTPSGTVEGVAQGLGPDGSLVVQALDGTRREIRVGDVERATTRND